MPLSPKVLLLTPPMTQLNTPYPATPYLTGFLRQEGFDVVQSDPAIELFHRLFSKAGLTAVEDLLKHSSNHHPSVVWFLKNALAYQSRIEPILRFLQGRDSTLLNRLCQPGFLPGGPRFRVLSDYELSEVPNTDHAKFLATLFIEDIADAIREGIDPRFELSRYAEKLALSSPGFDPLLRDLERTPTLVDQYLDEISKSLIELHRPDVLGITIPFPGNLYGGLRMAKVAKKLQPSVKVIMGGGYVNTELRAINDPRLFDYVDFLTLDDGERPLSCILKSLQGVDSRLLRTFTREGEKIVFNTDPSLRDIPVKDTGTPTYDGLPLSDYVSLLGLPNSMHRLWSDGRWNKLTLAHGCYWKKCTFCDTHLDYIGRFEPETAKNIVDKMEKLIAETGEAGFHFVDEAAPPALLSAVSEEIMLRNLVVTWWTNIRFEKSFSAALTAKMAKAGCIAVSGGLEVASDRLLALMEKGVTTDQVARVAHRFNEAGIMVHAYLMFGFPTQTVAETIDSLERVRQLFRSGCIQSAYWHRFSATAHSPIGKNPERYGIEILSKPSNFANNDLEFVDKTGVDHERFHPGLKKALYNYMHGVGLEEDVRSWFEFRVPRARVAKGWVEKAIYSQEQRKVISLSSALQEKSPERLF